MKTYLVTFADGRRVPVMFSGTVTPARARQLCERRFATEQIVRVDPHRAATHQAREQALSSIRGMGL